MFKIFLNIKAGWNLACRVEFFFAPEKSQDKEKFCSVHKILPTKWKTGLNKLYKLKRVVRVFNKYLEEKKISKPQEN
jgi:hypothetical protein